MMVIECRCKTLHLIVSGYTYCSNMTKFGMDTTVPHGAFGHKRYGKRVHVY